MFKKVYFFVMEVKVWFEGKTLKKPSKFDWKWSLHCQKIDKKKVWNGVDPPHPVMENSILFIFFIFETFPKNLLLETKQISFIKRYWMPKWQRLVQIIRRQFGPHYSKILMFYWESLIKEFLVDIPTSVHCRESLCSKVKTFPKLLCGLF